MLTKLLLVPMIAVLRMLVTHANHTSYVFYPMLSMLPILRIGVGPTSRPVRYYHFG